MLLSGSEITLSFGLIPMSLKYEATSLYIHSGEQFSREQILSTILNEFEIFYTESWNNIIPIWRKHCIHENSEVAFHTENGQHKGIFRGIASNGHAEIQINGKTQNFPAGMVTI